MAGSKPAAAQSADAASLCTPDVMRLCSEFIPDEGRIVACLKVKRRQLSAGCSNALSGGKAKSASSSSRKSGTSSKKKKRVRHHRG